MMWCDDCSEFVMKETAGITCIHHFNARAPLIFQEEYHGDVHNIFGTPPGKNPRGTRRVAFATKV